MVYIIKIMIVEAVSRVDGGKGLRSSRTSSVHGATRLRNLGSAVRAGLNLTCCLMLARKDDELGFRRDKFIIRCGYNNTTL